MRARAEILQIATLIVLVVIVILLLQVSSRQKAMEPSVEFTGQSIGKKLSNGATAKVDRMVGESAEDFKERLKEAIEIAEAQE